MTATQERIFIPSEDAFGTDEDAIDYLPAPEIKRIADDLIERHQRFAHLADVEIVYLWKAKGGKSGGGDRLGYCAKQSGLVRHFSEAEWVVWLAADNCRLYVLSNRQIEALVYHELSHAGENKDGQPVVIGHDWEGFAHEIEAYGLWHPSLPSIGRAIRQERLPGMDGVR